MFRAIWNLMKAVNSILPAVSITQVFRRLKFKRLALIATEI